MFNPKEDYKKIIEAVEIIKRVCEAHNGNCYSCPYGKGEYTCGIVNAENIAAHYGKYVFPKDWQIQQFKALK